MRAQSKPLSLLRFDTAARTAHRPLRGGSPIHVGDHAGTPKGAFGLSIIPN